MQRCSSGKASFQNRNQLVQQSSDTNDMLPWTSDILEPFFCTVVSRLIESESDFTAARLLRMLCESSVPVESIRRVPSLDGLWSNSFFWAPTLESIERFRMSSIPTQVRKMAQTTFVCRNMMATAANCSHRKTIMSRSSKDQLCRLKRITTSVNRLNPFDWPQRTSELIQ